MWGGQLRAKTTMWGRGESRGGRRPWAELGCPLWPSLLLSRERERRGSTKDHKQRSSRAIRRRNSLMLRWRFTPSVSEQAHCHLPREGGFGGFPWSRHNKSDLFLCGCTSCFSNPGDSRKTHRLFALRREGLRRGGANAAPPPAQGSQTLDPFSRSFVTCPYRRFSYVHHP